MRISPKERGHRLFEKLEARQMLSVTLSPGYQNDTQSIQNAINSVQPGGTVQLTAGTFHVSSTLNLDGRTLAGTPGQTVLQWTGGNDYLASTGSNSSLAGVTFSGAGLQISDGAQNVTVNDDAFQNISAPDAYHDNGITGTGGSNNVNITDNTFSGISGDGAYLFSLNNSNFDGNTITNCFEGVHAINFDGASSGQNCTFNYNVLTGISRHGIEIQNNWENLSVGWNDISDFNVQAGGNSHIALSIATGPGAGGAVAENVDVHDNVLLGTGPGVPSDPNYCFTAIEIMGVGSIVNHNYIANWGWGVLDGFTSNWQVTNNDFVGVTSQNGKDAVPESNGTSPSVDSGNAWVGSWNGAVPSGFAVANDGSAPIGGSTPPPPASAPTNPALPPATKTVASKPTKASGSGTGNSNNSSSSSSTLRQTMLGQR
jgi:hypothetical protein